MPVSTQWEPNGHYYPIQIAQFALSHYSKYLQEGEPDRKSLLTGSEDDLDTWSKESRTFVRSMWDRSRLSDVIEFQSSGMYCYNSLATKKQTSKFSSANFQKMLSTSRALTPLFGNGAGAFRIGKNSVVLIKIGKKI